MYEEEREGDGGRGKNRTEVPIYFTEKVRKNSVNEYST